MHAEPLGETLKGPKRDVAFASLDPGDVCAVQPEVLTEGLLAQLASDSDLADVLSHRPLQVALGHPASSAR